MKLFISHSSTDKRFVRKLKDDLNENDIQTWVDEDELQLGDSLSEKLDDALEESSHFLIVLSAASVKSEWVQYELAKALKQKDSNLLQKIIPVKYKDCDVPKALAGLLYVDLSKEVREVSGDRISFTSHGYKSFLERLCTSIRKSEKTLTSQDKIQIRKELKTDALNEEESLAHNIVRSSYVVVAYRSKETREKFTQRVLANLKNQQSQNEIKPILLPPLLKFVFKGIQIGDPIHFSKNFFGNEIGHFAGFRRDDLGVTIHPGIRKSLLLQKGSRYNVEVDVKNRHLNFIKR